MFCALACVPARHKESRAVTHYRTAIVDGHKVFYRKAGDPEAPSLLLLHGFPTSSHVFRDLIPLLADRYHVVAPDLLGFGFSDAPGPADRLPPRPRSSGARDSD